MRTTSTKAVLAVLALAAATLAGCQDADKAPAAAGPAASSASTGTGVAALSADEILQRAQAALAGAKSYRAKGVVDQDGQAIAIDLQVRGEDFAGSLALGEARVKLLALDGEKYLQPNEQFWIMSTDAKQGPILARGFRGRWVTGADKDPSFAELFAVGSAGDFLKPTGTLSKGEQKEIGGVAAIALKDSADPGSALYVATAGEPYPLRISGKDGSELVYSDFGKPVTGLEAPAPDRVVDLGKVQAK
ncbi:hypothetical protein COUCH_17230 [Couchioplanes caeruleus]|uniref:hypothetical protein n=1 Tax=Couchioplanes caeruleus TaxID=56438 RepID=UPI0020C03032|nr:hypothetical protein [Couchioplanes caeruleus]UQU67911.1 hypothetical protein COUCH_17230 [Couchioplanes caeruleus]